MEKLDETSLEELLEKVQGLTTVGTDKQVRSIMAVIAKCTKILSKDLKVASNEICKFNKSTTRLTWVLIALDVVLLFATVVLAWAALKT